eukprot:906645-Prymnesium_polylepis.1
MVVVPLSEVWPAATMAEPGARMSIQLPTLEYDASESPEVVAPTVTASGAEAGDWVHASSLYSLPAAATTETPV